MKIHNGFLLVNKPGGLSSFDVVQTVRRTFTGTKIGHAGTLDPLAEGLLILACGQATRLLQFLPIEPKVYQFEIQFGTETDTLDSSGKILCSGRPIPEEAKLYTVLSEFKGKLSQTPPIFSAIKVNGKRAYSLARKGLSPPMKPRDITVDMLKLLHFDHVAGRARCEVTCSGGTYVRSLARDIANRLDTVGYADRIIRTICGPFTVDAALPLNSIDTSINLIPVNEALCLPTIQADSVMINSLIYGRNIALPNGNSTDHQYVLIMSGVHFVALVHRIDGNYFHPDICAIASKGDVGDANS